MLGFAPFSTLPFSTAPETSPSVTVFLVGTEAVGEVGEFFPQNVEVNLLGVDAIGAIGTMSFRITGLVTLTGVSAMGRVTRPLLWTPIICDTDGHWQYNPCSAMSTWDDVDCNDDVNWQEIQT